MGKCLDIKAYREAMVQFLVAQDFNLMVTLNFNRDIPLRSAAKLLKEFDARLNRILLGSDWAKKPLSARAGFIAFPEHIESHLHYHLVMKHPDAERASVSICEIWDDLVPSGQADVRSIEADDRNRVAGYCSKDLYKTAMVELFTLSTEFATSKP